MNRLNEVMRSNERLAALLASLMTAGMMACVAAGLVQLIEWVEPGWGGSFLPGFSFLVALEALYSQRQLKAIGANVLAYRAAEWVLLLALLRLTLSLQHGWQAFRADLLGWQADFVGNFLDAEFVVGVMIVALAWLLSLWCGEDLIELEGDSELLAAESLEGISSNRRQVQKRLAAHLFALGGWLVFLAALVQVEVSFIDGTVALQGGSSLHVLVYFLLCLGLLSLTHLASRRAAWAWEHIAVRPEITRRWLVYSLVFLALLTGIAILLPTQYSMGFLPALAYLGAFLVALVLGLVALIVMPLFLILSLVMGLFQLAPPAEPNIPTMEELIPAASDFTGSSGGGSALWQALQSVLFWLVLVVIVGAAVVMFLQQNQALMEKLRRLPGLAWMGNTWRQFVGWLRRGGRRAPQALRDGLARLWARRKALPAPEIGSILRLRRLTPRQQVLFYYLALVRRGGEGGVPRQPAETPAEYARSLRAGLQSEADAVDALTERFIQARYRPQPVDAQQAGLARRAWERLRRALRKKAHVE